MNDLAAQLQGYDQYQYYNPSSTRVPNKMEVDTAQDVAMNRCQSFGYNHPSCQIAIQVAHSIGQKYANARLSDFGSVASELTPDEPAISGYIPGYNEAYENISDLFFTLENGFQQYPGDAYYNNVNLDEIQQYAQQAHLDRLSKFITSDVQMNYPELKDKPTPKPKKGSFPLWLTIFFGIIFLLLLFFFSRAKK